MSRGATMPPGKPAPVKDVVEWEGKNVVWCNGTYRIAVNDPQKATYITLWTDNNKRVGVLSTTHKCLKDKPWLAVSTVEIARQHRGKRLGIQMYRALLEYMDKSYMGLIGYQPDIGNKRQVPKIYRRLNAVEEGDYYLVYLNTQQ